LFVIEITFCGVSSLLYDGSMIFIGASFLLMTFSSVLSFLD